MIQLAIEMLLGMLGSAVIHEAGDPGKPVWLYTRGSHERRRHERYFRELNSVDPRAEIWR